MSQQAEGKYKTGLTKRIYERFGEENCYVLQLDANSRQGIPDRLVIFTGGFWAFLEGKTSADAPIRPNQPYYIEKFGRMCFAAFISPDNEEAVLHDLAAQVEYFWETRIS